MTKMKAEVKRFHSPDIPNLEGYQPPEKDNFAFLLQVMVGPANTEGEESFDIEVCTPKWLLDRYSKDKVLLGRHRIIVFRYDFDKIQKAISEYCEKCQGDTWEAVAQQLSCLGKWEFEGYLP